MLPIEPVLPELLRTLAAGTSAVLQAPPGAGKTTRVPLALLDEPWLDGGRLLVLEPRRLAARAAAHRMAHLLGERVGDTVGYRVRLDTRVGPRTRIEVVTEGVLARMLQGDPALEGVGCIVFDEFHERSLHADLGLALTLEARSVLRPELRVLVMSATLEAAPVAGLLGGAPVVTSEGRSHPVERVYLDHPVEGWIEPAVARVVRGALDRHAGDVLVFLPGEAEIRRTEQQLREGGLAPDVRLAPLYGSLPQAEQERAIAPSPAGERKVVLATSIAETSLTIEGIRVVVDSGLMRVPRFSPRTGMTRLETLRVSRASAEQRCGRAGRLGPGVCYRLWTQHEQAALVPHTAPEILEADLAPLALELAAWGTPEPDALRWLDAPPAAAFAQARELLAQLGAVDAEGGITPHGRRMAGLGLHPRLAHLLLRAEELGYGPLACDLAALLSGRDVLRGRGELRDADVRLRLGLLRDARTRGRPVPHAVHGLTVDRGGVHRVLAEAEHWRSRLGSRGAPPGAGPAAAAQADVEAAGLLLAFAYPDRIAQARPGGEGRFLLRNGRGAALDGPQPLAAAPYLVAAELGDRARESRIWLAAPLELGEIEAHFAEQVESRVEIAWDDAAGLVRARRVERLGALELREAPLAEPDPAALAGALVEAVRARGLEALPWTKASRQLRERLVFLHHADPEWPDASEAALLSTLEQWLRPHLWGIRRWDDLQRLDLGSILLERLGWEQRAALDELAPTHWEVPTGSRIPIDYSSPEAPVLAVRLQEMFGQRSTPRIARGRVPLTLHLLSPARRPVQVTQDLESFWRNAYFEVRSDLRGRYPKHPWPEDPLAAEPTRRTKRR